MHRGPCCFTLDGCGSFAELCVNVVKYRIAADGNSRTSIPCNSRIGAIAEDIPRTGNWEEVLLSALAGNIIYNNHPASSSE